MVHSGKWGIRGRRLTVVEQLVKVLAAGRGPADTNAVGLSKANGEHKGLPEDGSLGLHLLEVVDGRACPEHIPSEPPDTMLVCDLMPA